MRRAAAAMIVKDGRTLPGYLKDKVRAKCDKLTELRMQRSSDLATEEMCCSKFVEEGKEHRHTEQEHQTHNDDWWEAVDAIESMDDMCIQYDKTVLHLQYFIGDSKTSCGCQFCEALEEFRDGG